MILKNPKIFLIKNLLTAANNADASFPFKFCFKFKNNLANSVKFFESVKQIIISR